MFNLILKQTLTNSFRKGGGTFGVLAFYLIVFTLFAFALTPQGLQAYATAVMCVGLLLACITALPLLYEQDHEEGMLEQFLLQPVALELLVLAKLLGLYVAVIGPLLLLSPVIALMAGMDAAQAAHSLLKLLLVSPSILAIGSVTASLTLGHRRGGLLQALLTLPLAIPPLIFAAAGTGQGAIGFLAGLACITVPLSCYISASLIRINQH